MITRLYCIGLTALVLSTGCSPADGAATGRAVNDGGASRLANIRYTPITKWGDGQRTVRFSNYSFNYFPVLAVGATPDSVKDLAITQAGNVTIRLIDPMADSIKGELTTDEQKSMTTLSQSVTYDYTTCPRVPGVEQHRFVWQVNGTNNAFLPACAGTSYGITAILAPASDQELMTFVKAVVLRLASKTVS